jgi:DNA-binding winged helix-turn-helix (wHTH) protein
LELQFERIKLDGYIVDFQKQTVSHDGHVVQLQSKILQVLACLIAAQGQLVTIEQLMRQVWGNTIVSPNTLQRCIAQLRKAFDDNSQTQRLIKTYPRRGYELLLKPEPCDGVDTSQHIAVQHSIAQSSQADLVFAAAQTRSVRTGLCYRSYLTPLALLLFAGVTGAWYQTAQTVKSLEHSKAPLQLNVHSRLTATDAHEQLPTYSADGNWIAFSRFESFCHGDIWLQQVSTKTEWQLNKQPQRFEALAFAPDSQRLAALSVADCQAPQQPLCWQVQLYQLAQLSQVQQQPVGDCEQRELSQLQWQDQQHLLMLRRSALTGLRSLVRFDLVTAQTTEVFSDADVLSFLSMPDGGIALLAHQGSAETVLMRFNSQQQLIQATPLQYQQWSAFNPPSLLYLASREQLLLASAGLLFQIQPQGELSQQQLPSGLGLNQLAPHPQQSKLLASAGVTDFNLFSWQRQSGPSQQIFHSHAFESQARIAPLAATGTTSSIAFVSNRSGQNEIWLSEAGRLRQLSQLAIPSQINGLVWQADGQALLLNINDQLFRLTLSGQLEQLPLKLRVKQLHQLTANNKLLIEYQQEFTERLALFDLNTSELTALHTGQFNNARLDQHGTLWFTDPHFRLFRRPFHQASAKPAQAILTDTEVNAFTLVDETLVLTTKQAQLLQLNINTLQPIAPPVTLTASSWLNDANQDLVLFGTKTSIETELLELVAPAL